MISYYQALCDECGRCLTLSMHNPEPEILHRLRVAIKKLTALFHLIEFADPSFGSKMHLAKFKEIFKPAGAIRDLDITIALILAAATENAGEHYSILDLFSKQRQEKTRELKEQYSIISVQGSFYAEDVTRLLRDKVKKKTVEGFLSQKAKEFFKVKELPATTKRLHTLRKLVKEYMYTAVLAREEMRFIVVKKKALDKVHSCQQTLGQWHDHVIAITAISPVLKQGTLAGDKSLSELLGVLEEKEKAARESVIRVVKEIEL